MTPPKDFSLSCPVPIKKYPHVLMAHGGGGTLMHELINKILLAAFADCAFKAEHDSAVLTLERTKIAMTTDSYVVRPLFFPGGDIGSMAVHGTVNDLAMSGARPVYISVGLILEEGLSIETLWRIACSIREACLKSGVKIVTGDTKVVDKGKGDGIFINTTGIGVIEHGLTIAPKSVQPGDAVIVSGDLGRHGIAIMAAREGLEFESKIESDSAPLWGAVSRLLAEGIGVHCLRDLTRGGLASALNEIAQSSGAGIEIEETLIPAREDVRGACEMLGFDPLYVANEGRMVIFVPAGEAEKALAILRSTPEGKDACLIGVISGKNPGMVTMKSRIGVNRIVDMLSGEQLPRIC
ncbi:MAG: hydrogenase expression/formation protein HypE [Candidatus Omnitrophota bacterium]|nr:hydrogenase expression/formation protein HypE [Candidatus Omnitrophota bacterium]MDZ4241419.1 hydrogenase expression/formation protein HypE [Candidatus Omnitrophota bacterium]